MPKPMCQLNLTLDVPTAEQVEKIAYAVNIRPSGAGREILLQRLRLEKAGWKIEDEETLTLLEAVCRLDKKSREKIKELLSGSLAAGSQRIG